MSLLMPWQTLEQTFSYESFWTSREAVDSCSLSFDTSVITRHSKGAYSGLQTPGF